MSTQKAAAKALSSSGQDSIFKLLYAPFALLSARNEGALVGVLASAVGFLEGFSSETLETEGTFERDKDGSVVARGQLKLVPYAATRLSADLPSTAAVVSLAAQPAEQHLRHVERTVTIEQRITQPPPHKRDISEEQLHALLGCFTADPFSASKSFETLIRDTSSPALTRLAVTCCSQTGLAVSASSFKAMLSSLERTDKGLAKRVALDYEFEMDLTNYLNQFSQRAAPPSGVPESLQQAAALEPRRHPTTSRIKPPRQSRLERIRNKKKAS